LSSSEASPPSGARASSAAADAVLRVACERIGCAAAAIVVADSRARKVYGRTPADKQFADEHLSTLGQEFARRVTESREPIVTNKLKHARNAPVACRLVAVPLLSTAGKIVGALVVMNRPDGPKFDESTLRRAQRMARMLSDAEERKPRRRTQAEVAEEAVADRLLEQSLPASSAVDTEGVTVQPSAASRDTASAAPIGNASAEPHELMGWQKFRAEVQRWIAGAASGKTFCIAYGDIDRMHVLNEIRGFEAGDRVIATVGAAVNEHAVSVNGFASRLSGDRFMLMLPEVTLEAARGLLESINTDLRVKCAGTDSNRRVDVSMSWGVASSSANKVNLEQCFGEAEIACKAAKDRGRGRVESFHTDDHSIIRRHDDVVAIGHVRDALHEGRVEVYAQTIAPLINSALPLSYELLARLRDAEGHVIEPAQFLSAATRYQLLPEIDRAVVRRSFAQLQGFMRQHPDSAIRVSINLSGPTIGAVDFADWISMTMKEFGIRGSSIVFEITEAAAAANMTQLQICMKRLAQNGVSFALDDFGTGVNSLSYLKSLDIGTIKLDGSYVRDIERNSRSEALVTAIVQLANGMGITTVAEYVETAGVRRRLTELGVQFGQGFAIARPVPFADVLDAVAARGTEKISLTA
jgi:diguanylate cyclase (GGDEF)-like protein